MLSVTCPYCQGKSIFRFAEDKSVVAYEAVNTENCYDELPDENYHPEVDLFHCGSCGHFFYLNSVPAVGPNIAYIPVEAIEDRVKNICEVIDFKQKEYEKAAKSLQERVAKATPEELATRVPELFTRFQKMHHEMEVLNGEIDVLKYILQKDAIIPNTAKKASATVPERIEQFRDEFAFLSNFSNIKVRMDGIEYPTAENAFQAHKSSERYVRLKMAQITPAEAKKLGRNLPLPENWNDIRLGVMSAVVYQKFLQNPDAKDKLLATGNAVLQERNTWGDTFWGADMAGVGENHLGEILMAVRAKLRNDGT